MNVIWLCEIGKGDNVKQPMKGKQLNIKQIMINVRLLMFRIKRLKLMLMLLQWLCRLHNFNSSKQKQMLIAEVKKRKDDLTKLDGMLEKFIEAADPIQKALATE